MKVLVFEDEDTHFELLTRALREIAPRAEFQRFIGLPTPEQADRKFQRPPLMDGSIIVMPPEGQPQIIQLSELAFDCALVDGNLYYAQGEDIVPYLVRAGIKCATFTSSPAREREMFAAGAIAVCPKSCSLEQLRAALRQLDVQQEETEQS